MKLMRAAAVLILTIAIASVISVAADEPGREFTATAVVDGPQGVRKMPVTLVANRFTPVEEARHLADVLADGGQGALMAALAGRNDGQLRLGAIHLPIALVVAEPLRKGFRYMFLTPRRIQIEETTFGKESLGFPFGIAVFEVDGFGRGEGSLHVAAALHIDADGQVEVEDYDGADGSLDNVKRVR